MCVGRSFSTNASIALSEVMSSSEWEVPTHSIPFAERRRPRSNPRRPPLATTQHFMPFSPNKEGPDRALIRSVDRPATESAALDLKNESLPAAVDHNMQTLYTSRLPLR